MSFFQRCVWTLILGGYYTTWIYLTEKFIAAQKLRIIGESERRFTQSQVRLLFGQFYPWLCSEMVHLWANRCRLSHSRSSKPCFPCVLSPLALPSGCEETNDDAHLRPALATKEDILALRVLLPAQTRGLCSKLVVAPQHRRTSAGGLLYRAQRAGRPIDLQYPHRCIFLLLGPEIARCKCLSRSGR